MYSVFIDLMMIFGIPMLAFLFILEGALIGKFIPTDIVLPGAMIIFATASQDYLLILLLCSISSTIGQLLLFFLIGSRGDSALHEVSWLRRIPDKMLDKAEERFRRREGYAIIVSNMVPGIRGFLTIPAALDDMNPAVFTVYSFAGTFFFQLAFVSAAFVIGNAIL